MKFNTGDILIDERDPELRGASRGIFVFIYSGATTYNVVRIGGFVSAGKYSKEDWVSISGQLGTIRHVLIGHDRGVRKTTAGETEMINDKIKKAVRLKRNIVTILMRHK